MQKLIRWLKWMLGAWIIYVLMPDRAFDNAYSFRAYKHHGTDKEQRTGNLQYKL
ncbi:hypothetical protein HWQ46_24110 [Shewanella sp. D64]|uniref:hypothetical protein n=1 Tax=unclassified Shewanella TaxID=196818 RepID=UPI0022BA60D6|nr:MULTISPECIES: hypothetical protein [unclassified Shewanella]MEC4728610.1 hypothetical protein [Shewanella sp. D64]MEC4737859.1 hypothetical protein [Shewanella sp. E94]WBJ93886.1 hypothetical protein HWQ47_18405 [Shewanella sp. MTB7]